MNYIFKTNNVNRDFNYDLLCSIEERLSDGITYEEAIYFLHWVISRIEHNYEHIKDFKHGAFCGEAFELAVTILDKLKLDTYGFDMKPIVTGESKVGLHTLTKVRINVQESSGVVSKDFILDPTFGQFCIADRCKLENGLNTQFQPEPGYFLSLSPEGTVLGTSILNDGFFELNEENFKLYCDAFILSYGKPCDTRISEDKYIESIYIYEWKKIYRDYGNDVRTPSEIKNQLKLENNRRL